MPLRILKTRSKLLIAGDLAGEQLPAPRMRPYHSGVDGDLRFGLYEVRREERLLFRDGQVVALPPRAMELLLFLIASNGRLVTKEEILEKVWNLNPDTETRAVDNFVMRLRRHLEEDAREPRLLQTVRGVGYRLSDEISPR